MCCNQSWFYVGAYVVLWSSQAILIKTSQTRQNDASDSQYPYDILAMTLCIEVFKLCFSLAIFSLRSYGNAATSCAEKRAILVNKFPEGSYFMVPAAVYSIYNGLSFLNLKLMEPGTYRVLINIRIIFSGLLLQCFFRKTLTSRKWTGLVLLMVACFVEQSGSFSRTDGLTALIMMTIQALCSSLGGVYFQWLLQNRESAVMDVWIKNIFLYFWSILFNIAAILVFRPDLVAPSVFFAGFNSNAIAILVMAGLGGICTSLVLKHLDVLAKEYANFAEMVVVAMVQHVLFGTPLRLSLMLAIIVVCYSLYLYQTPSSTEQLIERRPSRERLTSPKSP